MFQASQLAHSHEVLNRYFQTNHGTRHSRLREETPKSSRSITSTSSQISPPSRAPQAVRLVILTLKTTHVCFLIKSLQWLQRESHWAPHWPSSSTFYLRVSVNAGPSAWKASPSFFTWVTPTFPFMSIITYQ